MPLADGQTLTDHELPLASVATQVTDTCSFEITVADTTTPEVAIGVQAGLRADDEERLRPSEREARASHAGPWTPSARRPASQGSSPR